MKKSIAKTSLQPWLDYFTMLQAHEESGFLQMEPAKHEAYITLPCLCAMSTDVSVEQVTQEDLSRMQRQLVRRIPRTLRRLRAYGGFRSGEGRAYLTRNFAVHVIGDNPPHDPLYTLLLTRRRRWWCLWCKREYIDIITY